MGTELGTKRCETGFNGWDVAQRSRVSVGIDVHFWDGHGHRKIDAA
jgi:hypothetical protein